MFKTIFKLSLTLTLALALSVGLISCSGPDSAVMLNLQIKDSMPQSIGEDYVIESGQLVFDEINTSASFTFDLPLSTRIVLPLGVYNISGQMQFGDYHLKMSLRQITLTSDAVVTLPWIIYNPGNTLVFGEIYFTGSLNAKGTGGLYDTYFTIYNNTDQVQYADGLAIVESKLHNASTDIILTPENQRQANFTVQAVYLIPGSGKDVPVQPGESIKIVDQAVDWNEHVAGALDHTDADFEWYDQSTSASVVDTDNPDVPNLDKWFCYTLTIWLPSNQCNRSYALVRFPEGMTMDRFIEQQKGEYDYVNAATGIEMHAQNSYLIKHEWIIDGVNLCPNEKFTETVLPPAIDRGYAAISEKNADVNRFGKKFVRKTSGVSEQGVTILQDTDNSTEDFEVVRAK